MAFGKAAVVKIKILPVNIRKAAAIKIGIGGFYIPQSQIFENGIGKAGTEEFAILQKAGTEVTFGKKAIGEIAVHKTRKAAFSK